MVGPIYITAENKAVLALEIAKTFPKAPPERIAELERAVERRAKPRFTGLSFSGNGSEVLAVTPAAREFMADYGYPDPGSGFYSVGLKDGQELFEAAKERGFDCGIQRMSARDRTNEQAEHEREESRYGWMREEL